jgi:hypothetical protein
MSLALPRRPPGAGTGATLILCFNSRMLNAVVGNVSWRREHGKEVLVEIGRLRAGEAAPAGQRGFPFDVNLAAPVAAAGGSEGFEEVVNQFQLIFGCEAHSQ